MQREATQGNTVRSNAREYVTLFHRTITEAHERGREYLVLVSRERWARRLLAVRESIGAIVPIDFDGGGARAS